MARRPQEMLVTASLVLSASCNSSHLPPRFDAASLAPSTPAMNPRQLAIPTLLRRHCAACHSANRAEGGLDLSYGSPCPDNRALFRHIKGGRQVSPPQTFIALYDRLTSVDSRRRMPPGHDIPEAEREALFLWVDQELQTLGMK